MLRRAMKLAVLAVLAGWLAAGEAFFPVMVASTVSCMGATCMSCVDMPIEDINDTKVVLSPCIQIDFENQDMAVHFLGTMNGATVLEKEISGVAPPTVCRSTARGLQLCLRFHDVNSVGSSLQVCAFLEGSIINNPATVSSSLGCFVADTQSTTVRHRTSPREQRRKGDRRQKGLSAYFRIME